MKIKRTLKKLTAAIEELSKESKQVVDFIKTLSNSKEGSHAKKVPAPNPKEKKIPKTFEIGLRVQCVIDGAILEGVIQRTNVAWTVIKLDTGAEASVRKTAIMFLGDSDAAANAAE